MGGFFIWLSSASRRILADCPTERPKYFGLGAAILVTGVMAGVSLSFALVNALKVSLRDAIIFAVLWGLAIMMIDRLFVASMHRQRNPLIYLIQALPRLLMAVVLGLVISTPFVLQIFKPEITDQVQKAQATAREAYFRGLATNPVNLTLQRDQDMVNQLAAEAATGGPGIDINKNPDLQNLNDQLATANAKLTYWTNQLNCQLNGGTTAGTACKPGYGPVGHNDQQQVATWQNKVTVLNGQVKTLTNSLLTQSQAQQNKLKDKANSELPAARQARDVAQHQLDLQTQNITSGIKNDTGLLTQLKALDAVTARNSMLQTARLLLFLLFLLIDIMPVFVKLLINLTPAGNYDLILADEEQMQLRMAANKRAVRQASQRWATQAEAIGIRYRNDALSADLPEMHEEIRKSRLRVERQWLKQHEAGQMRNVAQGEGISGIGSPPYVDGAHNGWSAGRPGNGTPPRGQWNGSTSSAGQPGSYGSFSATGSNLGGGWASSPPMQPGPVWQPPGPNGPEGSRWTRLSSLRLPRLPQFSRLLNRLRQTRPGPPPRPGPAEETMTQPLPHRPPAPEHDPVPGGGPEGPGGGPTRPEQPLDFGLAAANPDADPARPEAPPAQFTPEFRPEFTPEFRPEFRPEPPSEPRPGVRSEPPPEFGRESAPGYRPAHAAPSAGPTRPEQPLDFGLAAANPDADPARPEAPPEFGREPAEPDGDPAHPVALADIVAAPADPAGATRREPDTRRETWHDFDPMPAPEGRDEGDADGDSE